MKATELLKTDHRNVIELIHQARRVGKRNALLLNRIYDNFKVHATCEEEIFYPAMKKIGHKEVQKSVDEHRELDRLLEELMAIRIVKGVDLFMKELTAFEEALRSHVREEEDQLFVAAEDQLGDKLDDLGEKIEDLKIDLRTSRFGMAA